MTPHYTNTNNPIDFPKSENNMNERIKKLAEQATVYHNGGLGTEIESFDKEKFAQLIVRECASRLVDMDQQVKGQHNYYKHASIQVLLHFGIQP